MKSSLKKLFVLFFILLTDFFWEKKRERENILIIKRCLFSFQKQKINRYTCVCVRFALSWNQTLCFVLFIKLFYFDFVVVFYLRKKKVRVSSFFFIHYLISTTTTTTKTTLLKNENKTNKKSCTYKLAPATRKKKCLAFYVFIFIQFKWETSYRS